MKLTPGKQHSVIINYLKKNKKKILKSDAACFHIWHIFLREKGDIMDTERAAAFNVLKNINRRSAYLRRMFHRNTA